MAECKGKLPRHVIPLKCKIHHQIIIIVILIDKPFLSWGVIFRSDALECITRIYHKAFVVIVRVGVGKSNTVFINPCFWFKVFKAN